MNSSNVRISRKSHEFLRELAAREGTSLQSLLDRAIEELRRKCFLEEANAAFQRLRSDRRAWKHELEERNAWDRTMGDGLEKER